MSRFRLSPEAQSDLDAIRRYLTRKGGPTLARHVLGEIRRALRVIAESPGIGHKREDLTDEKVKFWPVFSYLIVYEPSMRPIGARHSWGAGRRDDVFGETSANVSGPRRQCLRLSQAGSNIPGARRALAHCRLRGVVTSSRKPPHTKDQHDRH